MITLPSEGTPRSLIARLLMEIPPEQGGNQGPEWQRHFPKNMQVPRPPDDLPTIPPGLGTCQSRLPTLPEPTTPSISPRSDPWTPPHQHLTLGCLLEIQIPGPSRSPGGWAQGSALFFSNFSPGNPDKQ